MIVDYCYTLGLWFNHTNTGIVFRWKKKHLKKCFSFMWSQSHLYFEYLAGFRWKTSTCLLKQSPYVLSKKKTHSFVHATFTLVVVSYMQGRLTEVWQLDFTKRPLWPPTTSPHIHARQWLASYPKTQPTGIERDLNCQLFGIWTTHFTSWAAVVQYFFFLTLLSLVFSMCHQ